MNNLKKNIKTTSDLDDKSYSQKNLDENKENDEDEKVKIDNEKLLNNQKIIYYLMKKSINTIKNPTKKLSLYFIINANIITKTNYIEINIIWEVFVILL